MQCFALPFNPLGPKMAKTVSYRNTTRFIRHLQAVHPVEDRVHPRQVLKNEVVLKCWNLAAQWEFL